MSVSAIFNTSTDQDWFQADLSAGVTYKITLDLDGGLEGLVALHGLAAYSAEDDEGLLSSLVSGLVTGRAELNGLLNAQGNLQIVFTPLTTSTYYIEASRTAEVVSPVSYTLQIEAVEDDFADNTDTSGVIAANSEVQAVIEEAGDADWFRAELLAGVTYQFIVSTTGEGAPLLSAYSDEDGGSTYTLVNGGRYEFGSATVDRNYQTLVFTPLESSTYYIDVDGTGWGETGAYTLELKVVEDDYADNTDTLGAIAVGGTLEGMIEVEDDADFIRMNLAAGTTYQLAIDIPEGNFMVPQVFSVVDDTGLDILGDSFRFDIGVGTLGDGTTALTFTTLNGGEYFLRVDTPVFIAETFSPFAYSVSLEAVDDDYADTTQTTGVIAVGGEANGVIETANDADWFRAELQGGTTYRVRITSESSGPSIEELTARLGEIRLELLTNPGLSQEEQDALQAEYDEIVLQTGEGIQLGLPFMINAASDDDLDALLDLAGRVEYVSTGPFDEPYTQLIFTPREDSTYYFDVHHNSETTGAYTLQLDAIEDDFADNVDTTGLIAVGGEVTGQIEDYGDVDWIRAELEAGVTYLVSVETDGGPSPLALPLSVSVVSREDSDGLGISLAGDLNVSHVLEYRRAETSYFTIGNQVRTAFTPLEGGTYYIQVDGLVSSAVGYTVSLEQIEDDYPDTTATTGVLLEGVGTINNPVTGTPLVIGAPTEGETLSVDTSALVDLDGLGEFSYQWLRDGVVIAGATAASYLLVAADVGAQLSVEVSYTDGGDTLEAVVSAETEAVLAIDTNSEPTGAVVITGTATEGETLSVDTSTLADADGLGEFSYQWLRDGVVIAGATAASYLLVAADVGAQISVEVSYTDGGDTLEAVVSTATEAVVAIDTNSEPTGTAVITGTATEGETLSVDTSTLADADGLGEFSYQWLRDGVAIAGATAASYLLVAADVGAQISVEVSYTDGGDTLEAVVSTATEAVVAIDTNSEPTGTAVITGTATEGETLSVDTSTLADADGLGEFNYQWLRDGVVIAGATAASYLLVAADVGAQISVEVSYTDGGDVLEAVVSDETEAVVAVDTPNEESAVFVFPGGQAALVTLVANSNNGQPDPDPSEAAVLSNLQQLDAPDDLPPNLYLPLGLVSFEAEVSEVGKTENFSLFVDQKVLVNGYWKQNAEGDWVNLASAIVHGSGGIRVDFSLTDGGEFDADGEANGVIVDPGALGTAPRPVLTIEDKVLALYIAYFDRAPDADGMAFWLAQAENGQTLYEISAGFANHPRFAQEYGGLSNQEIAEKIYLNVLHRPGDAEGIAYWANKIEEESLPKIVVDFTIGALEIDLEALLASEALTPEDYSVVFERQKILENLMQGSRHFLEFFGDATIPQGPPETVALTAAYQASVAILDTIDSDLNLVFDQRAALLPLVGQPEAMEQVLALLG